VAIFAVVTAVISILVFTAMRSRMPPLRWAPIRHGRLAWLWRREAWLLVLLAAFTNFFADIGILVVVPFLSSADVAVFGLCLKLALLVGYFVQIAQQMAVPDIAHARHAGDATAIRKAAWRSIAMPLVPTLASLAAAGLFGRELLSIFGPQFAEGRSVLFILVSTQVLRALAGPSSHLMTLRGVQGLNAALSAGAIVLLLLSSMVFTTLYGLLGAALAVLITYGCWLAATAIAPSRLGEARIDFMAVLPRLASLRKAA
jgi:O-antigen/teichoic acid export membrane protein